MPVEGTTQLSWNRNPEPLAGWSERQRHPKRVSKERYRATTAQKKRSGNNGWGVNNLCPTVQRFPTELRQKNIQKNDYIVLSVCRPQPAVPFPSLPVLDLMDPPPVRSANPEFLRSGPLGTGVRCADRWMCCTPPNIPPCFATIRGHPTLR
jgi:hypothetical protein